MTQFNPYMSPFGINQQYQPYQSYQSSYQQSVQVTKVNGENGARAYQIGPNSSALLLDESGTMVWLCTTDGAGYKTVSAYDIAPHRTAPAPDISGIEQRLTKLEEFMNEFTADSATVGSV